MVLDRYWGGKFKGLSITCLLGLEPATCYRRRASQEVDIYSRRMGASGWTARHTQRSVLTRTQDSCAPIVLQDLLRMRGNKCCS